MLKAVPRKVWIKLLVTDVIVLATLYGMHALGILCSVYRAKAACMENDDADSLAIIVTAMTIVLGIQVWTMKKRPPCKI